MTLHHATQSALDNIGESFELMECDPKLSDTAQFCEAYGVPLEEAANTILVASRRPEGHVAACVVLATTRLDVNGEVRRRLGVRKVSLTDADVTTSLTGMEIGGVTPFGLPEDIPIWIDSAVMDADSVVVGAGNRSAKIRCPPDLLLSIRRSEVIPDLARAVED